MTMYLVYIIILLLSLYNSFAEVIFQETFEDESHFDKRWVKSNYHGPSQGDFRMDPGDHYGDYWVHKGLQTVGNKKYFGISAKFDQPFSNRETDLVIQYQIKFEKFVQCGGGYIKVLGKDFDQSKLYSETPYKIMFGPDLCGDDKNIIQVILNYKDKYYPIKKKTQCKMDRFSHIYTLVIRSNNSYSVLIDNILQLSGDLEVDFGILPDKVIDNENAEPPSDWVSEKYIIDPTSVKPANWDDRVYIPDPSVKRPEYWDDDIDGVWQGPEILNPNYSGKWKPNKIENPKYKGPWNRPKIPNPLYVPDPNIYLYEDLGAVAFDLWQVKAGSIFDNILITDSYEEAYRIGHAHWEEQFEEEKEAYKRKRELEIQEKNKILKFDEERRREAGVLDEDLPFEQDRTEL